MANNEILLTAKGFAELEEELRNNPALAAERARRLAAEKEAEEQRERFKADCEYGGKTTAYLCRFQANLESCGESVQQCRKICFRAYKSVCGSKTSGNRWRRRKSKTFD